ncbi:MAG TPA: SUMF1/EgtB/PvdO family nonheme iron enzyme, partial [Chthoniobacterales bacterium]|nr:SUMF1/EgtB/PvdO family nonheme iron enzyme [Chthoniobacterales bacterium]
FFSTTMSPCGAFDMGGNVDQWTETPAKEDSSKVIVKGGSWQNDYKVNSFTNALDKFSKKHIDAQKAYNTVGFRVATKGIDPNASTFLSDVPDAMWLTPNETVSVALAGAVPLATVLWTTGAVGTGIVAASSGAAWCWEKMHCCAKRGSTLEEGAESNALATDHEGVELIAVHSGSAAPSQNVISIEPSNPSSLSVGTLIDKLRSCWTKKPAAVDQNIVSDVTTQEQVKGEVSAPPSPSAASHQMEPSDPSVVSAPTYWSAIKDKVSGYWTKEAVVIDPSTVSDVTTQESVSGNAIVPLSPSAVGHQVEPSDSSAVSAPTCWSAIKDKISGYWTKETAVADLNATSEAMAQEPAKGEIVVPSSPLVAGHQVESSDSSTVSAPTCWDKVKGCWTKETVTSDTSAQSDVTSQEVVKGEVTAPSSPSSSAHQADTENSGSNFKNSPSRDSLPHNTEEKRSVPPNSPTTASPETVVSELHVHQQHGEINLEAIETENTSVSSSSAIPSHSLSQEKSSEAEAKETLNSNVDSDQIIATHPEVAVQNRSQQTEQLSSPVNEKADHLVQIAPLQEVQSEELSDSHASSSTASTSKASGHKGKNNHKKK